jgi:hypothetical protein
VRRILCAATVLFACGHDAAAPAPTCGSVELLVAASDYSSSAVGGAPGQGRAVLRAGVDLGRDPALESSSGRAFFLARDRDLVFELDPTCGAVVAEASVHDLAPVEPRTGVVGTANPHDVAAAPDGTLFVVLYDVGKLALVKDGKSAGSIDLSSFDADGNPQAESIRIVDVGGVPKAFVALERLDDHDFPKSKQPSQMLRLDVATRTIEATIELAGRDPFNAMAEQDGALFLAEPGSFDVTGEDQAGIERFDTATSTTALLVAEKDLGGSVAEVAVTSGCGAAIVAGPEPNVNPTSLVTFDPKSGRIAQRGVLATPGYDLQGLAWRGTSLFVGDRRGGAEGFPVHVFDADESCMLRESSRTIDLSQRPVALRPAK